MIAAAPYFGTPRVRRLLLASALVLAFASPSPAATSTSASTLKKPSPYPSAAAMSGSPVDLIEELDGTRINWTTGRLTTSGVGTPGDRGAMAFRRTLSSRAARADAYRRMAGALEGVRVDANSRMKDLAIADDALRGRMNDFVKSAKLLETNYWPDGSAELVLGAELRGDRSLAALVGTPPVIPMPRPSGMASAKASAEPEAIEPEPKASPGTSRDVVTTPVPIRATFSSLIVEGKGLGAQPALIPGVREAVRGSEGKAIELSRGAVKYLRDGAELDGDAGLNPLKVRAVRTYGALRVDFVLTPESVEALKMALKSKKLAPGFNLLIQI